MSSTVTNDAEDKSNGNLLPFRGTIKSITNENSTIPPKSSKGSQYEVYPSKRETQKAKNKKREAAEGVGEVTKSKVTKYDPSELMNKLEEFSNVWNDCPTVSDENNISSRISFGYVDQQKLNSKDKHENKYNKDKSYSQIVFEKQKANGASVKNHNYEDSRIKDWSAKNSLQTSQENNCKEIETSSMAQGGRNSIEHYDSKLADLKRRKAVQEQRKLLDEKKNIIKQALSSMDGKNKINKKVIFSDAEETEGNHQLVNSDLELHENKGKKSYKLFEDDDSDIETDLKLNHQFEGKKGQKLLELQSRFASDSRFVLDKRFHESGSEEESDHEAVEDVNLAEEKRKQLAILESIVNKEIKPLSEIKKSKKNAEDTFMVRFDPTREDHEKYIVKSQESPKDEEVTKKKKKKKEDEEEASKNSSSKIEVSNEKFFTVKEDLKKTLQNESGTEFSLLKLFGSKEEEVQEFHNYLDENVSVKKQKHKTKNPFKHDSSESEPEEEEPQKNIKEEKPQAISWGTTFFFTEHDKRLQEAFEFLKVPEEAGDTKEYAEKRKMLKDFIRNKFKNNNRKQIHFKKKLGGLKRTFKIKKRTQN